ncbi:MAG: cold shock domain-containing protein [Candidatus Eremiobacterota bacterium]
MTEIEEKTKEEGKAKTFIVYNSINLLTKYKIADSTLILHLTNGKTITGKMRWYDDYAIKIILSDGTGSVTVPIHNIIYYECNHIQLEGEQDKISRVFRGVPKCTNKEISQLTKYKKNNELIHFYMEDNVEIKGRLKWFVDYLYCIEPDNREPDCQIVKRHIVYYKKIEAPKAERTEKGHIKALVKDRGFGFITSGKEDIFFHYSELADKEIEPETGSEVHFGIKETPKGKVAVNIKIS